MSRCEPHIRCRRPSMTTPVMLFAKVLGVAVSVSLLGFDVRGPVALFVDRRVVGSCRRIGGRKHKVQCLTDAIAGDVRPYMRAMTALPSANRPLRYAAATCASTGNELSRGGLNSKRQMPSEL